MKSLYCFFGFISLFITVVSTHGNSVLLKDVQTLVFMDDAYTTGVRFPAVPQLKNIGELVSRQYRPSNVICYNKGLDFYGDVMWLCEATLNNRYKFSLQTITCEGYEYPDDPSILVGSCGIEYELIRTTLSDEIVLGFFFIFIAFICIVLAAGCRNGSSFHPRYSGHYTTSGVNHRAPDTHRSQGGATTSRRREQPSAPPPYSGFTTSDHR